MRCAVLDLGSNSFHLLVADLDGPTVSPVFREREMLHLGREVERHGMVGDDARRAAVATVGRFARLAGHHGAVVTRAVATAALREAANGSDVIDELTAVAGFEVRVLGGVEESRLAYAGARSAVAVHGGPVLVLDLGGGSLELAGGEGGRMILSESVRLGASRLSAAVDTDPPSPREIGLLRQRVDDALEPILPAVRGLRPTTTIIVGGTARALGRMVAIRRRTWLPATLNQLRVRRDDLDELTDELLGCDLEDRKRLRGMKERRADHVHVGALVLGRTLELLEVTAATVSDWGLREGVLLDAHGVKAPPEPHELRAGEVARVREAFVPGDPHPVHVARVASQLFEASGDLHGLAASDRELLVHAASLHSVGEAVALRRQHVHGAYLLENAELHGFDPAETAMLATLVRFHRSRGIDRSYPPFASLDVPCQHRTERLLALLQVADVLDAARDQAVSMRGVRRTSNTAVLRVSGARLKLIDDELARRAPLFERTFGVDVIVEEDRSP